jgi:hypothetical protein
MITPEGWNPARYRPAHPGVENRPDQGDMKKLLFFIRPVDRELVPPQVIYDYKEAGCDVDAVQWYWVADRLGVYSGYPAYACEHQMLTD